MLGTLIAGSAVDGNTRNYMNRETKMFKSLHTEGGLVRALLVLATLVSISQAQSYAKVRLVGNSSNSGRVEIYYYGKWGTICDDNWGPEEVEVVCRSLGHWSGRRIAVTPGNGTIWLDNVVCRGDEMLLHQCKHNGFAIHNCNHSQDVGVSCNVNPGVVKSCDFDMDMCGFFTYRRSKYRWVLHSGHTRTYQSGPSRDHTPGSFQAGKYVYLDARFGFIGQRNYLKSRFNISMDSGSVYFWYHMYGRHVGGLNVYLRDRTKNNLIWSQSGQQGDVWKFACRSILSPISEAHVIFEGIRGIKDTGDIAIDDFGMSTESCPNQNGSCGFNGYYCGYEAIEENGINTKWFMGYQIMPLKDHGGHTNGQYITMESSGTEGDRAHLKSPPIKSYKSKMRIDFYYYLYGEATGELQVRFEKIGSNYSSLSKRKVWQDFGDHGKRWNYGCMELPVGESGSIRFTGISGRKKGIFIALDDVNITKGDCNVDVSQKMCTFDNTLMCKYKINCTSLREYSWRRNYGRTPTEATGPPSDDSPRTYGYYLYAESSYGNPGDAVSITFPVSQVKGRYVKFSYHMYGNTVGDLIVHFRTNGVDNEVWKLSGDQENVWRKECLEIDFNIDAISFIAVRGSSFTGDIAIDNVFLVTQPCSPKCDFQYGMCNYSIVFTNKDFKWENILYSNISGVINRIAAVSPHNNTIEGETTTLITTGIQPAGNSSLQFNYMMFGRNVGKFSVSLKIYQVNPAFTQNQRDSSVEVWSTSDNRTNDWILGCVDLPTEEYVTVHFKVTGGDGMDGNVYLDDVAYFPGKSCRFGIAENNCYFDEPNVCEYNVRCSDADRYTWIRGRNTKTKGTGPIEDHTGKWKRYFMYAEASTGRPGDMTHLEFANINPPSEHYLEFYYLMNGADIGSFHVSLETSGKKEIKWQDHGNSGLNWIKGCVDMNGHANVTIVFTATRGYGPYGDVAIDDIAFKAGVCKGHSIHCDFEDDIMCGYRNITDRNTWIRTESKDNSTNGYQMTPETQYLTNVLASPSENITDSCIRVHYKMIGHFCTLDVYTSSGKSQMFKVSGDNVTDYKIGQIYIKQAVTRIIFKSITHSYWYAVCNTLIDRVEVTNGTCPQLVCPAKMGMVCKDNKHCLMEEQLCNRVDECQDGSDEQNCNDFLDCDFESSYYCGYQLGQGWRRLRVNNYVDSRLRRNNSEYIMVLTNSNGSMTSPVASVSNSCVQFYHLGTHFKETQLEVLVHHYTGNIRNSSVVWRHRDSSDIGWALGQFSLSAGKVYLEFKGKAMAGNVVIDDVLLRNGSCPTLGSMMIRKGSRSLIPPFELTERAYVAKFTVRLIDGEHAAQGIVEIKRNGNWNKICRDHTNNNLLNLMCLELGYNDTNRGTFLGNSPYRDGDFLHIDCMDNGTSLESCTISTCHNCHCQNIRVDCSNTTCPSSHVLCPSSNEAQSNTTNECIPRHNLCDGEYDCPGGTDEDNCGNCTINQFKCRSMECISNSLRCNGIKDCEDGSDEYHCFKYSETSKLMEVYFNGNYIPLCKDNLLEQETGDMLCKTIGRSYSKIGTTNTVGNGVFFTSQNQHQGQLLRGFDLNPPRSCEILKLTCAHGECGKRSQKLFDYMIQFGSNSIPGEWPWQIALFYKGTYICGGTLIGNYNIITAAHCVINKSAYDIIVFAGSIQRSFGGQTYTVSRIYVHPSFHNYLIQNGVALVQLQRPVEMSDYIHPACLPEKSWDLDMVCFTTGWGRNEEGVNLEILQETRVDLLSRSDCKNHRRDAKEAVVCANNKEPYQPGCYGDSGGPLVCRNDHGFWELFGITSYSISGCASRISIPQAYADVYSLKSWILAHML